MPVLTTDADEFLSAWRALPSDRWGASTPRAVMLMSPEGLSASSVTCADNRYMDVDAAVDCHRVHAQHRALASALSAQLPTWTFPGDAATPDATFLNNAFATVPGRLILAAMRYPERQRETARSDVRAFFEDVAGYEIRDLAGPDRVAELTGSLVIDRQRGVGLCGLGERCDLAGAQAMHDAFGLRLTYAFELASGEYHTNVVMSVLAGRTLMLHREGLADADVGAVLAEVYAGECVELSAVEKNAFAGNSIALTGATVWMSCRAAAALTPSAHAHLERLGWQVDCVDLSEIEKAGGSLRCCVAEVF